MASTPPYKLRRLSRDAVITLTVIETREWRLRHAVATSLVRLASWVLGAGFRVHVADAEKVK